MVVDDDSEILLPSFPSIFPSSLLAGGIMFDFLYSMSGVANVGSVDSSSMLLCVPGSMYDSDCFLLGLRITPASSKGITMDSTKESMCNASSPLFSGNTGMKDDSGIWLSSLCDAGIKSNSGLLLSLSMAAINESGMLSLSNSVGMDGFGISLLLIKDGSRMSLIISASGRYWFGDSREAGCEEGKGGALMQDTRSF